MKLKILVLLIVALLTFAFAVSPTVYAEGEELTTTTIEDITTSLETTTQSAIQAEIDYQIEKAQTLIMSGVVAIGGTSAVGGVISVFLTKRRKQIDKQIDAAKGAYEQVKTNIADKFDTFQRKTELAQEKAAKFQADMAAKYDAAIIKANEQTAKATAIIEKYQLREDALVAFANEEINKTVAAVESTIQEVSVECGKE